MASYQFRLLLVDFVHDRAAECKEALGRVMRGSGNKRLSALLRRVAEGEQPVVYQCNSLQDARETAASLQRAGLTVVLDG